MISKITILGELLTNDINGMMIGGKQFKKGLVIETQVDEDTYKRMLLAVENKWFSIRADNYQEWLISRGRSPLSYAKARVIEVAEPEVLVTEPEVKVEEISPEVTPEVTETAETEVAETDLETKDETKDEIKPQVKKKK